MHSPVPSHTSTLHPVRFLLTKRNNRRQRTNTSVLHEPVQPSYRAIDCSAGTEDEQPTVPDNPSIASSVVASSSVTPSTRYPDGDTTLTVRSSSTTWTRRSRARSSCGHHARTVAMCTPRPSAIEVQVAPTLRCETHDAIARCLTASGYRFPGPRFTLDNARLNAFGSDIVTPSPRASRPRGYADIRTGQRETLPLVGTLDKLPVATPRIALGSAIR